MTTNCGGVSPAPSAAGVGWFGCSPASRHEPSLYGGVGVSPAGVSGALVGVAPSGPPPGPPGAAPPPPTFGTSHAASTAAAPAPSPPASRRRRLTSATC